MLSVLSGLLQALDQKGMCYISGIQRVPFYLVNQTLSLQSCDRVLPEWFLVFFAVRQARETAYHCAYQDGPRYRRWHFGNAKTRYLWNNLPALKHLHKELVIHRDIAARNVLVGDNYGMIPSLRPPSYLTWGLCSRVYSRYHNTQRAFLW